MKKYIITGGTKLKGTATVSGSKNAALPILAAALLTSEDIILRNVPVMLRDIRTMIDLLAMLGKRISIEKNRLIIRDTGRKAYKATYEIVKQMRASIVVLGPLLARYGKAHVSLPGGCAFGPRPVDLHLYGLSQLGAVISMKQGYIDASAKQGLSGKKINLSGEFGPSVLGTDNVMMAASLSEGTTIIENAAREPETADLADFLNAMGADIQGRGSSVLTINGREKLRGCEYSIIPDRIEAGTLMTAAAVTGGSVVLKYGCAEHLESVIQTYTQIGVDIKNKDGCITVEGKNPAHYTPFSITTLPFPGFPTDMQPFLMALGCVIKGVSSITEGIYPNRFTHAAEFNRMGAEITVENNTALIKGRGKLEGASVQSSDLRAGAGLVVAALAANGKTEVRRVYHIERGYELLPEKLRKLGAHIRQTRDEII